MALDDMKEKPHVIIITESWLKHDEAKFYNLNNYQSVANCRTNHRGGGVIMYIRNDIKFNTVYNELYDKSHLLMISLNDLNFKIAGFYRSQATKHEQFFEILENLLDKTNNLICLGDANFNILKKDDQTTNKYLDILENNNYKILNNINTENYIYSEEKNETHYISILDHIFSDYFDSDKKFNIEIRDVDFTDHRLLFFKCKLKTKKQTLFPTYQKKN